MKRLFLTGLNLFIIAWANAQFIPVLLRYDNIETYTWAGAWFSASNSGYYTNASVSPSASAATFGVGSSTSATEQNWYVLPNITGLDPTRSHVFKFRLASYRFTSLNSTRGVDAADYMEVRLSTNGGVSYTPEIRVTGFSNAYWNYNTNATIIKTSNGINSIYSPSAGGDRTLTGDGYSTIELTIPAGITQLAVDLYFRANSAGEEWWIDNIELYKLEPDAILPIELISFGGEQGNNGIQLNWMTSQELNSSHFIVERSVNALDWDSIASINASGNHSGSIYDAVDARPFMGTNYYRLRQYDIDGAFTLSEVIAVYYKLDNVEAYVYQQNSTVYLKNCEVFNRFKLFDASGKIVKEQNLIEGNQFEVNDLSSGLYYLNLISEDAVSTIIKVRIIN